MFFLCLAPSGCCLVIHILQGIRHEPGSLFCLPLDAGALPQQAKWLGESKEMHHVGGFRKPMPPWVTGFCRACGVFANACQGGFLNHFAWKVLPSPTTQEPNGVTVIVLVSLPLPFVSVSSSITRAFTTPSPRVPPSGQQNCRTSSWPCHISCGQSPRYFSTWCFVLALLYQICCSVFTLPRTPTTTEVFNLRFFGGCSVAWLQGCEVSKLTHAHWPLAFLDSHGRSVIFRTLSSWGPKFRSSGLPFWFTVLVYHAGLPAK